MTTTPITLEQVEATARAVAAEFPDRTNEGFCAYTDEDENPHCFAAVIADLLGVDIPLPGTHQNERNVRFLCFPGKMWDGVFTAPAVRFLGKAQAKADSNNPWSLCVPTADEVEA